MAFSDVAKTVFWALLLLQVAPFFIKSIKQNYSDLLETKTKVGVISVLRDYSRTKSYTQRAEKYFEDPAMKE